MSTPDTLTPYDTGRRGEPQVWSHITPREFAVASPIERELEADRFGKVDLDGDDGETLVTVWIERNDAGEHVVHIQEHTTEVMVKVHS